MPARDLQSGKAAAHLPSLSQAALFKGHSTQKALDKQDQLGCTVTVSQSLIHTVYTKIPE